MSIDFLKNKVILVAGGTGSFGKNFVKFLLANSEARKIIVFSRDELKQFQMEKELLDERLRFFIGDVRDLPRLERAFNGVDIVVHAAALKQVPILEYNPFEAVKTNILGSQNVIEAAIDQKVEKVLLVSTDKAVQPINLYGSTKLCAEKLFVSGNSYSPDRSKFSVVRYGNVIGSRGSIIETLVKSKSSKVQITDLAMTRFWITLDQSFALVLFALENMLGGEIFVPKIPSLKLVDLFDALAPTAEKEIIGIRPGEKLHETLLIKEEAKHALELEKYFVIIPDNYDTFAKDKFNKYFSTGKKIAPDFTFASDTNQTWLTKDDFLGLVKL
ncbi:UDP-N-acetylglucosamine 4,6-dehydratase (inverting) [Candidatus Falkowbacteria bacterium RIFCSPHIGHO2_02_FULL_42_9]|uniref:UDP-N-acetylglucosamine 4,6-dehydratase (Inverting) n=1 Tax=Candidatus Falkowbacteria bacterium RIFCSPHIGHO2_02_FULL_42_9 TaxID=1797986 RepID=A0A1F5S9T2_9BACT|nr:MAG: UDP-N-acetylglucosamine 4,6-dehydratase (inverting) [Candidatus Falkowbacteria bacterium RIFCSPHIGHO2_02_FULL_42_9]